MNRSIVTLTSVSRAEIIPGQSQALSEEQMNRPLRTRIRGRAGGQTTPETGLTRYESLDDTRSGFGLSRRTPLPRPWRHSKFLFGPLARLAHSLKTATTPALSPKLQPSIIWHIFARAATKALSSLETLNLGAVFMLFLKGVLNRLAADMAAKNRSAIDIASLFMPNILIPPESYPAILAALLILGFCVYTTVLPNHKTWTPLRIGLSIPAIFLFIDFGWSGAYPRNKRGAHLGMGTAAFYGIMKVIEVCWVRELDDERPRWVLKPQISKKVAAGDKKESEDMTPTVLPLPQDTWGRIAYAFDFVTTVRGASWYGDRVWEFAPPYLYDYSAPSRARHILFNVAFLLLQTLTADCVDIYIKSIAWDRTYGTPVTSLPIPLQITTVLIVGMQTMLGLTLPSSSFAVIAVSLGSNPSSWAPILPKFPFAAPNISEFWSTYWHHLFRRTWRRMASGLIWCLPRSFKTNPTTVRITRYTAIFFLSSLLHVVILAGIPSKWAHPMPRPFLGVDAGTVKFFFTQPLGLVLEAAVVFPLTEDFEPYTRTELRRTFGWMWFLSTGRYWCDAWIGHGLFEPLEVPVYVSPIRGLLYDQWIV